MYLTFIPHGVKMYLAGIMEIILVVAVFYFLVRFILGFFIKEEDKPSTEIETIRKVASELNHKLDKIVELSEGNKTVNSNIKAKKGNDADTG